MRVLIVDDSAFMRRALRQMLEKPGLKVVGTASNGEEGVKEALRLRPDVVTLDIEMPVMDGLTALKAIRTQITPMPAVLMCSSLTSEGSHEALKAMRLGASDVIAKGSSTFCLGAESIADELVAKVRAVALGRRAKQNVAGRLPGLVATGVGGAGKPRVEANHRLSASTDLVLIGSSTGGPPVLETVIGALPAGYRAPVVVAQHMPLMFTKSLAERLDAECAVNVEHATNGVAIEAGRVYIAPGGSHTRVVRNRLGRIVLEISGEPASALYKPSVNELFASGAKATQGQGRVVAVVLTGMGEDGLEGARLLKPKGATILAQDVQSCVVYGMPKAVAQAGLADGSLSPDEIGTVLSTLGGQAESPRQVA